MDPETKREFPKAQEEPKQGNLVRNKKFPFRGRVYKFIQEGDKRILVIKTPEGSEVGDEIINWES